MVRVEFKSILILACACSAVQSAAQSGPQPGGSTRLVVAPPVADQNLSKQAPADVVRDIVKVLREDYVFPDRAGTIIRKLEQNLAGGRYSVVNPMTLAELITDDLRQASGGDQHMYLNYKPAEAAALGKRGGQAPDLEFFRQQMAGMNHGITELKVLPGNVRYMKVAQWFWDPSGATRAIYDDAMRFLRGGDGIIIDLRDNGGGSAEPVQYVASHFLDPGKKMITFRSGPKEVEEIRSQAIAAGKISKPLMVLVGPGSASASEEFAAHVKNFHFGTLIGKTTAGAGNPNGEFPTSHGFVVSVSTGTALHAVTNKGWEAVGIAPDREVELNRALDIAHAEALKAQLATASPRRRPLLEWMINALNAEGRNAFTPEQLSSIAGRYEGERMIIARDGRLYWKRGDGPEQEMVPVPGRAFALGSKLGPRVEIDPSGNLVIVRPMGPPEHVGRLAV